MKVTIESARQTLQQAQDLQDKIMSQEFLDGMVALRNAILLSERAAMLAAERDAGEDEVTRWLWAYKPTGQDDHWHMTSVFYTDKEAHTQLSEAYDYIKLRWSAQLFDAFVG